jgi:THO complex subunit 2
MELGVLRALLKMAGGWAFSDASQAAALAPIQLQGRAGSTLLKREIMSFGVHEDFSVEASTAIRRMLQKDHFGTTILILLAQVKHQILFEDGKGPPKPIKLIGNLVDLCQTTMAILLDFVTDSAVERSVTDGQPPEATLNLAVSMPSLLELIENFELDLCSVWMICRPLVRAASYSMDGVETRAPSVELTKLARFRIDEDVRKAYKSRLPKATWSHISSELYESFYCNTLFDIFLPDDSYKAEITRLEKEIDSKAKSKNENDAKDLARMKKATAQLSSDWNKQRHHVESVRGELKAKASSFFTSDNVTKEAMTTFFTSCIFPRCMQGPDDALYCVHFIAMLHSFDTSGFGTLQLYDLMIVSLSRAVFGLTEGEAANVAILLESLWKNVSRWRYDDECFAEEMHRKMGCNMVQENDEIGPVTSETYTVLYNKWHASLGGAMLGCLQSTEYMHW